MEETHHRIGRGGMGEIAGHVKAYNPPHTTPIEAILI
jgi:hypothetical protein